jgi:hypothetical protein
MQVFIQVLGTSDCTVSRQLRVRVINKLDISWRAVRMSGAIVIIAIGIAVAIIIDMICAVFLARVTATARYAFIDIRTI